MKSITNKFIKVIIIITVGYLLLQVGRAWGKHESFDNYYEQGRRQAIYELKMSILNEKIPFWFGDVKINPKLKKLEVRNVNINGN